MLCCKGTGNQAGRVGVDGIMCMLAVVTTNSYAGKYPSGMNHRGAASGNSNCSTELLQVVRGNPRIAHNPQYVCMPKCEQVEEDLPVCFLVCKKWNNL